jgi:hypothetical protein
MVRKVTRESPSTIAYVAVGLIAGFIVGYVTFGKRFFSFPRPMLPFLVVGLTGALMYATVQLRRAGLAILMIVLLYLTQVAMTPPIRPASLAAGVFFAIPVGFALLAGSYAQKALTRIKIGRFIAMGTILAVGYGVMMLLFLVRSHTDIRMAWVFTQARVGLELGAAMGLGFELVDLIWLRPERPPKKTGRSPDSANPST